MKASNNCNAKLTKENIIDICRDYQLGVELLCKAKKYTYKELAKKYGVSRYTIYAVTKEKVYKNVKRS